MQARTIRITPNTAHAHGTLWHLTDNIRSIVLTKTKHYEMNTRNEKETYSRVTDFVIQSVSSVIRKHESVQENEVLCRWNIEENKKRKRLNYFSISKHDGNWKENKSSNYSEFCLNNILNNNIGNLYCAFPKLIYSTAHFNTAEILLPRLYIAELPIGAQRNYKE